MSKVNLERESLVFVKKEERTKQLLKEIKQSFQEDKNLITLKVTISKNFHLTKVLLAHLKLISYPYFE